MVGGGGEWSAGSARRLSKIRSKAGAGVRCWTTQRGQATIGLRRPSGSADLRSQATGVGLRRRLPKDLVLPDRFPPFFTLHVDDQHRLWVQRFGPGGEQVMEVFDSAGVAVARVDNFPLNARWPLLFRQGRVYGFVADESCAATARWAN